MANGTKVDSSNYLINCVIVRLVRSLNFDNHILRNLRYDGIETRPSASNGLWCCLLLPTILLLYSFLYNVSPLYGMVAYLSVGLLCYCMLFIIFLSVSCLVLRQRVGGCVAASVVTTLLIYGILKQNLKFSLLYSAISIYSFSAILKKVVTAFPKTFTIGEAMVVTQGIVLFLIAVLSRILWNVGDKTDKEMEFVNTINLAILSSVGIIVTALVVMADRPTNIQMLRDVTGIAGIVALIMLHLMIGAGCIIDIASYVFLDVVKARLLAFWCFISTIAGLVLVYRTRMAIKADTVTRKVFHILASIVFMSGIIWDVHLITLAAGFGFAVVVLFEALRKSNIEIITPALESAFQVYRDEKDIGSFALTPIYLYVGMACPLVLVPVHKDYQLELLSGVLSIGIGDTAASWFGVKYGSKKWAGSNKTLEGTGFNIISQIATVYFLDITNLLKVRYGLLRTIIAAVITGLVEAKTDQIDNLILPLITIIAYQITWFL